MISLCKDPKGSLVFGNPQKSPTAAVVFSNIDHRRQSSVVANMTVLKNMDTKQP